MQAEKYEPKWGSKNVTKRLKIIEQFAIYEFSQNDKRRIHKNRLVEGFGQQRENKPLNKYLRDLILKKTDLHLMGVESSEYRISWTNLLWAFNQQGLTSTEKVSKLMEKEIAIKNSVTPAAYVDTFSKQEEKEAKDFFDLSDLIENHSNLLTENAEYVEDEVTTRLKSHHQNKSRAVRSMFWSGWYDYDVDACAYTLIHQHLINNVLPWWGKVDFEFKVLPLTYQRKAEFRQGLANELGVTVDQVKEVLSSVLFNARLDKNPFSGVYKMLKENEVDVDSFYSKAKKSVVLNRLIEELRFAWPKLMTYWTNQNDKSGRKKFADERINQETGEITRRFRPTRFRACIYFELERKVLDSIRNYMSGKVCHLMHDGFFTPEKIDLEKLRNQIEQETGFKVSLKESQL